MELEGSAAFVGLRMAAATVVVMAVVWIKGMVMTEIRGFGRRKARVWESNTDKFHEGWEEKRKRDVNVYVDFKERRLVKNKGERIVGGKIPER